MAYNHLLLQMSLIQWGRIISPQTKAPSKAITLFRLTNQIIANRNTRQLLILPTIVAMRTLLPGVPVDLAEFQAHRTPHYSLPFILSVQMEASAKIMFLPQGMVLPLIHFEFHKIKLCDIIPLTECTVETKAAI